MKKLRSKILSVFLAMSILASILLPLGGGNSFLLLKAEGMIDGKFSGEQYKKALWMVTRFYGAQRMGEGPNWLTMEHNVNATYNGGKSFLKDADGAHDLTGGWFDCGDHVLFGQTFFFSAYMLALAYKTFPEGFHDLYNGTNYSDYKASGDWSINGGSPNNIPDVLEELKYATDWIIKATPNGSTFYSQKGNGDKDHKQWVTAGFMSTLTENDGGESDKPREFTKNPNDGVMPSFAAGALAIMSDIYRQYDPAYADLCLAHAKNAFAYAETKKNNSVGAGGYYGAAKDPQTIFVIAASELYMATNDNTYRSKIDTSQIKPNYWALDYSNGHDLAYYAAAMALPDQRSSILSKMSNEALKPYRDNINGEKITTRGSDWGVLRYPGNTAFSMALYANAVGSTSDDQYILNQIDYILGANNARQSFVTGFDDKPTGVSSETKTVKLPHHRNVFLNDLNVNDSIKATLPIPERNRYFGYMVGGSRTSTSFQESIQQYQVSEGGIDYNAGLLGALGYVVSHKAPAQKTQPCGDGNHTPGAEATCGKPQTCTVCSTQLAPATGAHVRKDENCTLCKNCTVTGLERNCGTQSPCEAHKGVTKAEVISVSGSGSTPSVTVRVTNNENAEILAGWKVRLIASTGQIASSPRDPLITSIGISEQNGSTAPASNAAQWYFSDRKGSTTTPVNPSEITLRTTENDVFKIPSGGEVTVTIPLYNSSGVPLTPSGWTAEFSYTLGAAQTTETTTVTTTPDITTTLETTDTTTPDETTTGFDTPDTSSDTTTPEDAVFTITFDQNYDGKPDDMAMHTNVNGNGKLPFLPPMPTERGDYDFLGWTIMKDGSGASVTVNTVFTEDTTLYAQWEYRFSDVSSYQIAFNQNYADCPADFITSTHTNTGYGGPDYKVKAMPQNPVRENYEFEGWFDTKASYGGTEITENTRFYKPTTVYARWKWVGGGVMTTETTFETTTPPDTDTDITTDSGDITTTTPDSDVTTTDPDITSSDYSSETTTSDIITTLDNTDASDTATDTDATDTTVTTETMTTETETTVTTQEGTETTPDITTTTPDITTTPPDITTTTPDITTTTPDITTTTPDITTTTPNITTTMPNITTTTPDITTDTSDDGTTTPDITTTPEESGTTNTVTSDITTTKTPDITTNPPVTVTTPPATQPPPQINHGILSREGRAAGEPTIFCFIEILLYLVNMPSEAKDNPAAILSPEGDAANQPTIFCGIEILLYIVNMPTYKSITKAKI
ncbi:MAG: glycoside hydrolase family 9 protein [Oscillospiraceae bacterium]|nr:glycoside hydrolase family 9 protein [Oscillospiraceae bacterium]